MCVCVVFIISDLSLHSVLTKHRGLWPEVIEVSGIVSSEDNIRNQIVGHKKAGENQLFSSGTISSLGFSLAPLSINYHLLSIWLPDLYSWT